MKTCFAVAFLAAALQGAPVELALGLNGDVRLGDTGASLALKVHADGWADTATGVRKDFAFPDPATGTATFGLYDQKGQCAEGRATLLSLPGERALLAASLVSTANQTPQETVLSLGLPASSFAGGRWSASDGRSGTFAPTWDKKTVSFWQDRVTWVEVTPKTGATLRFTFPEPTHAMFQDDRTWSPAFTMRIFPKTDDRRAFNRGDERAFLCFLSSPAGVKTSIDQPVVVKSGPDWTPLDYHKDILAGSALDFSNQGLQDAPAGKYGWLGNEHGHFAFAARPGVRQRFYGVNLCFSASFPDHAFADKLVTRLVRLGYNAVRIHHYESEQGVVKGALDGLALNPERMDRLDYLLAQCYAKGVYVTTDLFTCRSVAWRTLGFDREGILDKQVYKNLTAVHEGAYRNWAAFASNLLTHVNAYTGRAYRDEPGLPLISLVNEGSLLWCWDKIRTLAPMRTAWERWLAERKAAEPEKYRDVPADVRKVKSWNNPAMVAFMAYLERRTFARQAAYLRALGVKAMLTNENCGGEEAPMRAVREDLYDYVDNHFYVDHPHFLAKPWQLPSRCPNTNPVLAARPAPEVCAKTRLASKPFTITEWNFSGPGQYRGVGGIMTGAVAARDDFDGLWRFAYSHSLEGLYDGHGFPGYFDVGTDPLGQAGDRASICLFLRGDLPAHTADALSIDRTRGSLRLVTPRTAGGFVPSGPLVAGPLSFDAGDAATTVWASSLDAHPIATSRRLLVTHLTDVQANGNVYADREKRTLLKWGANPPLVRNGNAEVSLALSEAPAYAVWELDTSGRRLAPMPHAVKGGRLVFTADVKGPHGARMLYEVVRE